MNVLDCVQMDSNELRMVSTFHTSSTAIGDSLQPNPLFLPDQLCDVTPLPDLQGQALTCAPPNNLTCALYLTCALSTHLHTFRGKVKVKGHSTTNNLLGGG